MADITFGRVVHSENILVRAAKAVGNFFILLTETSGRVDEINRLQSMTDEQLAALGLDRQDIPHHVFKDMYYL